MEYQQLNKEFSRMSRYYADKPYECPFYKITGSSEWEDWYLHGAFEPSEFEDVVTEWSKQHPRPIYPTFWELIQWIVDHSNDPLLKELEIHELLDERVPDAAAEELGIVPINECDLTKYSES